MFGSLLDLVTKPIFDVTDAVAETVGLDVSARKLILEMMALGLTIYQISDMTGIAISVIEKAIADD